jgi:hypothetical protein
MTMRLSGDQIANSPVGRHPGIAKIIGVAFRQHDAVGEADEQQLELGVVLGHVARVLVRIAPGEREFSVQRHGIAEKPSFS